MAQGNSGRIVIDIDPQLKSQIYEALHQRGSNMREWFLTSASRELLDELPTSSAANHSKPK